MTSALARPGVTSRKINVRKCFMVHQKHWRFATHRSTDAHVPTLSTSRVSYRVLIDVTSRQIAKVFVKKLRATCLRGCAPIAMERDSNPRRWVLQSVGVTLYRLHDSQ